MVKGNGMGFPATQTGLIFYVVLTISSYNYLVLLKTATT